jgi:hypothetical protein
MITIQKKIESKSFRLVALCILSLCLAIPALCTTASPANPTVRMSSIIDPPEILLPPPPPSLYQGSTARVSSIIDPPEILLPPPPPSLYQRSTAMEQTA